MRLGTAAAWCVAALVLGCNGRCGKSAPVDTLDAGTAQRTMAAEGLGAAPRPPRVGVPSVDLRQAILTAVPEFRGMSGLYTVAVVERRYLADFSPGQEVAAALAPGFTARGFKPAAVDGGPLAAESPPFFLEAFREAGLPVVRVGLVIPGEKLVELLQTPAPLSSQSMAQRFPAAPGDNAAPYEEAFAFEVHYRASRESSDRLLGQLASGLVASGWSAASDAGLLGLPDAGLPEALDARFSGPNGAALTLHRAGERVTVTWDQPLTSGR